MKSLKNKAKNIAKAKAENIKSKQSLNSSKKLFVIGIDEVGRGPIAGPVTLGACCIFNQPRAQKIFQGVKESKQLNAEKREGWAKKMRIAQKEKIIFFAVASVSAQVIDEKGISYAIKTALKKALYAVIKKSALKVDDCKILLDGGLHAPKEFTNQRTIIKGDEKEMAIALASIIAKVTRDSFMCKIAKLPQYSNYGFEVHKGYGTAGHYGAIKKYGVTGEHRKRWIK